MKKVILSMTFLSLCAVSIAQNRSMPPTPPPPPPIQDVNQLSEVRNSYSYCELIAQPRAFSTKLNIILDFGQETKFFQDRRLRDEETGNVKKFNSIIDALNYMSSQGWEFMQAYNAVGSVNTNVNNVEMHYLLRRKN